MSDAATPRTAAEAYLTTLGERGVDWLFGNAGTDFAPVIEAYAAAGGDADHLPRPVEVLHETVAVAMAHGTAELAPALERAVGACRTGQQALVSVHVSYPDAANH